MRSIATVVVGLVCCGTAGCYSLQPVRQQPLAPGMKMSVGINDAGRAALTGLVGPNVSDIEGRLLERDGTAYVLAVSQVRTFRDGTQVWSGERLRVNTEYVNIVSQRKFSRGRTAIVSAAAVGLIAILASQGIIGSLSGDDAKLPGDTLATIRIPLFHKR